MQHTQCKQVSINLPVSPLSSISLAEPRSATLHGHNIQLHGHNIQLHGHNIQLHGHNIQLHQNSNCCSPSYDFLNLFNCPTSAEEWARADQEMVRLVVPAVLAATLWRKRTNCFAMAFIINSQVCMAAEPKASNVLLKHLNNLTLFRFLLWSCERRGTICEMNYIMPKS